MFWKKIQTILYLEQFLVKGGEVGILLLLPILLLNKRIGLFELGLLSTVLSISQFGFSLMSGVIMEKLGYKKMMVISAIFVTFSWLILAFKPVLILMILAYLLSGASSGLFETSGISIVAKNLGKGKRSEGIGNLAMVGDVGRIIFTGVTTIVVSYFGLTFFSMINTVLGLGLLAILYYVKLENSSENDNQFDQIRQSTNFALYFKNKNLLLSFIVSWLDSFSGASLFIFLPLLFARKGLPYEESGILSVILFVGYMMGRKFLGKMADKIGTIKTLMIGESFMALIILAIIIANNFYVLLFLLLLLGMATRGTSPVCKALVADAMPDNLSMDHGLAVSQSGSRLAGIVSRPAFSGIVGLWGVPWVFAVSASLALLINVPLQMKRE